MPITRLRKFVRDLCGDRSGNAMLLVAMGAPVLFGTAGMGVDMAQFYLWKRELQYAADQAALAGAWARGNGDSGTGYQTRASQEFAVNLSATSGYTTTSAATLADYNGGTQNSVVVTASVTATLPFTQLILGSGTTIAVRSQATFETTQEFTACMYALHPTAPKALWFNGGPLVNAACGVGAMSNASNSINTNGSSGPQNINWAIGGGGIVDDMNAFANAQVVENFDGLFDPFEDLTPPDNPIPRSLSCGSSSMTWTADEARTETTAYLYYRGQNANQAENAGIYGGFLEAKLSVTTTTSLLGQTYTTLPVSGTSTTFSSLYQVAGSGPDKIYEQTKKITAVTFSNIASTGASSGSMLPGTYSNFEISCDTTLASGIYVINGGKFKLNAGNSLIGSGVMFVLKNGAELQINGGAAVNLSPMTANELIAAGVPAGNAAELAGMLIFEDPNSPGSTKSSINGGASFDVNGVIYMPNSDIHLAGKMQATSQCLMVATKTIQISGTADLTTLCPVGKTHDIVVGDGGTRVRLVA